MVSLENRTYIIILGAAFELIGGILLAFEMIDLLDKIEKWNLSLQYKIQAKEKESQINFASVILLFVPFIFIDHIEKELSLKDIFYLVFTILTLNMLLHINIVGFRLLHFFEYLAKKLGTKRVIGILGVIFLCLGFMIQFYINLTTK